MNPPVRVAVLAALPREIAGLVRGYAPDATLKRHKIFLYRLPSAIVVAAGMGAGRAALAFQAALEAAPASEVISTGLAGSCSPALPVGTVLVAGTVIDARTGERFVGEAGEPQAVLVTAGAIAGVTEKARLASTYGAAMVDMEAATVARLADAHGLRFRAIKAISDAHDFELSALSRFAGAQGQFQTARFALHTAMHPAQWRAAAELGRNSQGALKALASRLSDLLHSS